MEGKYIQSMSVLSMISMIKKRAKLHQKLVLNGLEEIMGADTEEFKTARKLVLDNTNDFVRSIIKYIFGDDFEGPIS